MSGSALDFTQARLRRMYRAAREAGYASLRFGEEGGVDTPYILWRHDIDLELPAMLAMAEAEAAEGIRSTYFLMTRSWFYNLFSWEGMAAVRRLEELGHGVGLHCDLHLPRDADPSDELVEERVLAEFALVDAAFPGVFRRVVSFHNPPVGVVRRDFPSFYSAYQPKFFEDIKYLSDSNRRWREGPPEHWFDSAAHPRLSILLHPVIWAYPGETMPEGMRGFLERRAELCRQGLIDDDVWV
jgi:hypothetical protein